MQAVHPAARWGATEYLLAGIGDVLALANWQRSGSKKIKRPEPMPRPGDDNARAVKADPDETRRRLLDQRDRMRR